MKAKTLGEIAAELRALGVRGGEWKTNAERHLETCCAVTGPCAEHRAALTRALVGQAWRHAIVAITYLDTIGATGRHDEGDNFKRGAWAALQMTWIVDSPADLAAEILGGSHG